MSRYVTNVGSSTVKLIENTPDVLRQTVINSIMNGSNIADDILQTMTKTYSHEVDKAYNYSVNGDYTYKTPLGTGLPIILDRNKVNSIEQKVRAANPLPSNYEIRFETIGANVFPALPQSTDSRYLMVQRWAAAYLLTYGYHADGRNLYFNYPSTELFEVTPTGNNVIGNFTGMGIDYLADFYYYIEYVDTNGVPQSIKLKQAPTLAQLDLYNIYFFAYGHVYYKDTHEIVIDSKPIIWVYQQNLNIYPDIALEFTTPESLIEQTSQTLPIVPLRMENNRLCDPANAGKPFYDTSKRMLDYFGLDIQQFDGAIEDNPDVKDVDHAYITVGIDVFSNTNEAKQYMWHFFHELYYNNFNQSYETTLQNPFPNGWTWLYYTNLRWDRIERSFKTVTTNDIYKRVGTIDKRIVLDEQGEDYLEIAYYTENLEGNPLATPRWKVEVIRVYGLHLLNRIYQTAQSVMTALDASKEQEEALFIPLHWELIKNNLSPLERNTLYYDSLRIMFNSYERTKLKWYQTGLFKFVTIIIAVAISIFTYGLGTGLLVALAGAAIGAVLMKLFEFVVKLFGDVLGSIINVIIIAAAIYFGATNGFITNITDMVVQSINFASQAFGVVIESQMEELSRDHLEFMEYAKAQMDELEEVQAELNQSYLMDPLGVFGLIGMIPGQSADSYVYSKTGMYLDLAPAGYNELSNWVDTQLTLPQLMR